MTKVKNEKINLVQTGEKIYKKFKIKRYLYLLLGLLLISVAFNGFLLSNNIVCGGVSGLSIVFKKLFGFEPSIFIFITSIALLIISYFALGIEKTKGSILGSLLFPIFVNLTENISLYLNFGQSEIFVSTLFGGILYGVGAGLVFKAGYTTGGTDIVKQIVSKYGKISIGNALLISDGIIVLSGVFVFGIIKLMYALVALYIISFLTDRVLLGISDSKAFYIIAEEDEKIKNFVLKELGHGVTTFDAKGGFTKAKQKVLFCVIPTKDYFKLKEGISKIDSSAFFVATDAYEVHGGE